MGNWPANLLTSATLTPASSGRPGPGEINDAGDAQGADLVQLQCVVAPHDGFRAELAQVLDQVVDERVVVVDDKYAGRHAADASGLAVTASGQLHRGEHGSPVTYPLYMPRRTKEAPGRVTPRADARRRGRTCLPPAAAIQLPCRRSTATAPCGCRVLMLTFFACGILMIVLNYISLLPAAPSNWYLLGGLGLIVCGFAISTQYR